MADEYIRKQDVLNLPQSIERNLRGEIVEISVDVGAIEALPSVDVVQVVRCKDCRKCSYDSLFNYYWCNLTLGTRRVKPDDFCSYGEREG